MTAATPLPSDDRPPRRVMLFSRGTALRCPAGHRFRDVLIWREGGLRCTHKGEKGVEDCSRLVYLVGGFHDLGGKPYVLVVEVTPQEMHTMAERGMSAGEAMRYLGLSFGGGE